MDLCLYWEKLGSLEVGVRIEWRDMAEKYKSRQEVTNFFFLISNSKIDAMAWSKTLVNNFKIGMNL